jgi:hypothetical protein
METNTNSPCYSLKGNGRKPGCAPCGNRMPVRNNVSLVLALIRDLGTIDIPTDIGSGGRCDSPGLRSYVGIPKFGSALHPQ